MLGRAQLRLAVSCKHIVYLVPMYLAEFLRPAAIEQYDFSISFLNVRSIKMKQLKLNSLFYLPKKCIDEYIENNLLILWINIINVNIFIDNYKNK